MQEASNPRSDNRAPASTVPASRRDIQRRALRELVPLATECATKESQIEEEHRAAVTKQEKDSERATWAIEERLKSGKEAIQAKHHDRVQQINAQHRADTDALNASVKTARQRIHFDCKAVERDVKKEYDQAKWLAESLFDGTQGQLREDAKKAKDLLASQMQLIEEREQQTASLMQLYGLAVPRRAQQPPGAERVEGDPAAVFAEQCDAIVRHYKALAALRLPRLFVGARPHFLGALLCVIAMALTQGALSTTELRLGAIGIAGGTSLVIVVAAGMLLRAVSRKHVRLAYTPLAQAIDKARAAAQTQSENSRKARDAQLAEAAEKCQKERQAAKEKFDPLLVAAGRRRDSALQAVQADFTQKLAAIQSQHEQAMTEAKEWLECSLAEVQQRYERETQAARDRHESAVAENERRYKESRTTLEQHLTDGLARIQAPIEAAMPRQVHDWNDATWNEWTPPTSFPSLVPFGHLTIDLRKIASSVPRTCELRLPLPEAFSVPTSLAFPRQASLLIQTDRSGHEAGIRIMQMVMTRLLTSLPPGCVRFTLIDPVGLGQNFAGFMHLADHDEALVGTRIWTEADHIEQRLADLTEHMETVIQKYLRNEFETIDDYNVQAGELAEPYRFLVIADFPEGFSPDSLRRLSSIATSGARCGVYTLVLRDTRHPISAGIALDELEAHSVNLIWNGSRFVWKDEVFEQLPLTMDAPPAEEFLTRMMDIVGQAAKEAKRVEVPFDLVTPSDEGMWTNKSDLELTVPIGQLGATRLQALRLGRGVAQHTLIAGKTGSGKSNLLHVLVTNLAMWYSPDQVEFYLVDFKKGVEFKTYATHVLPHARAIAVESDREFGLSVLHRVDGELTRRGDLFRKAGVQELASYRQATGLPMPRTLLIIDEFQEFFSEDDKLAQDAGLLLDRLVRQGRAFGIHVLLGSQTIGGTSGLSRSTLGQMAVRIALQCSDADSQLILGDSNSAARLLSRPGEAIYNDAGGLVEGNSPFQVAWLPDDCRDRYLNKVIARSTAMPHHYPTLIVFEGNAPADITQNKRLAQYLQAREWPAASATSRGWVGDPVAIKDPTAIPFRRQSGANLLVIGQQEESAMAVMTSAMISLAAGQSPRDALFYVLDGNAPDAPLANVFKQVAEALPHTVRLVDYRAVPEVMAELGDLWQKRLGSQESRPPSIYLFLYALQRYRVLRKQEESFSFSATDEEKKPAPDKLFAELLREGPSMGIHTLVWCDTTATIDRMLDRTSLREFDYRILFQMSANDSSNLIDSPVANKLGFHRAICYSEEQGLMEKFRPYGLPEPAFLQAVKRQLARG